MATKKVNEKQESFFKTFFSMRSFVLCIGGVALLIMAFNLFPSYNWVYNSMLKGNWDIIKKYPKTTLDQRKEMKIGFVFTYFNFIKENTPEDAIILFPTVEQMSEKKSEQHLDKLLYKQEITYFLYPRQVVYANETSNPLYNKVTHVAIANGYGYDKLSYEVGNKTSFTVLPKQQPQK